MSHSPVNHVDKPTPEHGSFNEDASEKAVAKGEGEILETRFADLTRWETIKTFKKTVMFCVMAAFSGVSDGYQMQLTGNIIAYQSFVDQFGTETVDGVATLNDGITGTWTGLLAVAVIIGVFYAPWQTERLGHKWSMYLFTLVLILATVVEIVARDWKTWLGAKIIFGFGIGLVTTTMTTYLSEIAPHQIRGFSVALYQLAFAVGQLCSAIALQIVTTSYTGTRAYMPAIYSQFVFHGLWLICAILLPDSPWYLAKRGKADQAKKALKQLVGNVAGYDLEYEFKVTINEIKNHEREEALEEKPSWKEVFTGSNLKRTIAASIAMSYQQIVGGSVFFTYFTYYFSQAGLPDPFLATVIVFVLIVAFVGVSWVVIETFGRRRTLLIGGTLLVIWNICIGIVGCVEQTKAAQNTALAMTCLYMITYACSCAPIGYVSAVELATPRLRQKTSSISFTSWQVLAIVFSFAAPTMITQFGLKTSFFFAGFTAFFTVILFFVFPESSQRTNAEMDEMYALGLKPWQFRKHKTTLDLSGLKGRRGYRPDSAI